MTRLTNTTYLTQHHQLKDEWFSESGGAFMMLSPADQWALHDFYEFTLNLSDADLILHRRMVTQAQPSLPHRAGKALVKLARFTDRLEKYRVSPRTAKRKKGAPTSIRILSQVRPHIDPHQLAKVLIEAIKEDPRP